MLVKMLTTQTGTLNNGLGNITMIYREGCVYDAPVEDAEYWLAHGFAEIVPEETTQASVECCEDARCEETQEYSPSLRKYGKRKRK